MHLLLKVLMLYCWCAHSCLTAQPAQPLARRYTHVEGLLSVNTNQVAQDTKGYIWVATAGGVCRFDGYQFVPIPVTNGQEINAFGLTADEHGTIWAIAMNGLVYRAEGDSVRPVATVNKAVQKYRNRFVVPHDFKVERQAVWLSLGQLGILRIDEQGRDSLFAPDAKPGMIVAALADGRLTGQVVNSDKDPSVKKTAILPIRWQDHNAIWRTEVELQTPLGPGQVIVTPMDSTRYLLAYGGRIYCLEKGRCLWFSEVGKRIFYMVVEKNTGAVFAALGEGGGLRQYANLEALRQNRYALFEPNETIRHFFIDREGGWWLTVQERGILYYPNPTARIYAPFAGMENDIPKKLAAKNAAVYYIGTAKGRVFEWNLLQQRAVPLPPLPFPTPILDMVFDSLTGRLWVASNYLQYFENGRWFKQDFPKDRGIPALKLCLSAQKPVLYICSYKGVLTLDRRTLQIINHTFSGGKKVNADDIQEDAQGEVWVSTPNGLLQYVSDSLVRSPNLPPALRQPIHRMDGTHDGSILLSADHQVVRWAGGDQAHLYKMPSGEAVAHFQLAQMSPDGHLWATTRTGLVHWAQDSNPPIRYGAAHGLPPGSVSDLDIKSDTLWLATADGLVCFSPSQLSKPPLIQPFFEKIWVNQKERAFSDNMRFPYDENNLQIQLATLHYRTGDQTLYRYRLRPSDAWTETRQRTLMFFSLGQGRYQLEVQAQNADGAWGTSAQLQWRIQPPFWLSAWFWSFVVAVLTGGVFWFFRYRLRQSQKALALENKILDLERAAMQAQMNPHFIFNCLNSIQSFILQNDQQQATLYLANFANLVRDTLNASVNGKVSLDEEIRMLQQYLGLEKLRFKDRFDFQIETAAGLDPFDFDFPPLLIQPLVENAVLHGMSNKETAGYVHIRFSEPEDRQLLVTVTDNGPGLQPIKDKPAKTPHQSVGMGITRRRLALLQPSREQPALTIQNRLNAVGEIVGTEAQLWIRI